MHILIYCETNIPIKKDYSISRLVSGITLGDLPYIQELQNARTRMQTDASSKPKHSQLDYYEVMHRLVKNLPFSGPRLMTGETTEQGLRTLRVLKLEAVST